ncbi:MAG: STAS domain-containing protein [Rhodocyclaceae bacterium]|nr:STAS domain-containing protein [Rhodocyclaceae bacterium]MDZ4213261.1 STAS domain-containing protein [Rhodocyclaceae bacterium]
MMQVSHDTSGSHATLRLNGSFDMESNAPFRSAYRQALNERALRSLTLELSGVDYMDSSALGMLLLLKGEVEKQGVTVILAGCQPFVLRVLTTANFHRMFKIA